MVWRETEVYKKRVVRRLLVTSCIICLKRDEYEEIRLLVLEERIGVLLWLHRNNLQQEKMSGM